MDGRSEYHVVALFNQFARNYQTAIAVARTTTTIVDPAFATKVTLVTPALAGTYRVGWVATMDLDPVAGRQWGARLFNVTDAVTIGTIKRGEPVQISDRKVESGFAEIIFAGAAKTFSVQFNTSNIMSAAGIEDARIEFWRVS